MLSQSFLYVSKEIQPEGDRSPSHRASRMKSLDSAGTAMGWTRSLPAPTRCAEPCPAVPHLWKPWSCDLQCSRPLLSSLLLWRKLLQLFAEHNVPLISCQLCRAEQFPTAGSPPSSPPPSFAERETLLFNIWRSGLQHGVPGVHTLPFSMDPVPAMPGAFPSEAQHGWLSLLPAGHGTKAVKRQKVTAFLQHLLFFAGGCMKQGGGRWMYPAWLHPALQPTHAGDRVDFSWAFWQKKQFC